MRRIPGTTLFLATLLGVFLLLMLALRILRWLHPESGRMITHEIRDMVAILQGSLEGMPGVPGMFSAPLALPNPLVLAGVVVGVGLVWIVCRRSRRDQQRSRNNLS